MLSQHYTAKVQTFEELAIAISKRYVSLCKILDFNDFLTV